MPLTKKTRNKQGIGLVEVIAALGISMVVITTLVSLSLFTLRSSLRSKLLLKGTELANKELELVRAFRDANTWPVFLTDVGLCDEVDSKCSISTVGILAVEGSQDAGDTDGVVVYFRVSDPINGDDIDDTDEIVRVLVTAEWRIASEADLKTTHVYTDLTNWQTK